jgi:hypothetical protein
MLKVDLAEKTLLVHIGKHIQYLGCHGIQSTKVLLAGNVSAWRRLAERSEPKTGGDIQPDDGKGTGVVIFNAKNASTHGCRRRLRLND